MEQAEMLYGEDWDSEEFQTALKVVIKCEIQSLLERLSATGEETVLLTASASELCTGHLASPKALNFVNTSDVGNMKNKFLNFITGSTIAGPHTNKTAPMVQGTSGVKAPEVPAFLFNSFDQTTKKTDTITKSVDNKNVNVNNQTKSVEKRPLELGQLSQAQSNDPKRRKTESSAPSAVVKGTSDNSSTNVSTTPVLSQSSSTTSLTQPSKLKTTKVVSKSGGFTEERLSDAEFQKIVAQYKGSQTLPGVSDIKLPTGTQSQMLQQKQLQVSTGTSKVTKLVSQSAPCVATSSQNVVNQSASAFKKVSSSKTTEISMKCEFKNSSQSETVSDKKNELDKENQPSQASKSGTDKGTDKAPSEIDRVASSGVNTKKKEEKDNTTSVSENRLDNIDSLDTETLIRMTKQKHFENMSEADREIQAKLGQLSSKLSWVVEYPKDAKGQKSQSGQGPMQEGAAMPPPRQFHEPYIENEDGDMEEEYDEDDEDDDDDDEFNEDDLDEEDKAALRAMREAHRRKMENNASMEGFQEGASFPMGYALPEGYDGSEGEMLGLEYGENYDEEGDYNEEYGEYGDGESDSAMHRMMVAGNERLQGSNMRPGHGEMAGALPQPYVGPSSPTAENFLLLGPIMAKCLICNKIIRKVEMKSHNENHMKELPYDEDDEEELEELEGVMEEQDEDKYGEDLEEMQEGEMYTEEGEYSEHYDELGEDQDDEPEYTAEKFVAEKLVAEKLNVTTDSEDTKSSVCDICNKSFKNRGNLQRHRKKIHSLDKDSSEIQCPCCSKTFKTPTNFQKHLKKVHPGYEETLKGDTEDRNESSFKCGVCGTELSSEQLLTEHMDTHT